MNFQASNQLGYHWNDAGNTYNWSSGLVIPDATWCMIAVSVTSTAATAYLCQASGITTATNTVSHTSSVLDDIKIAFDDAAARYFAGNIAIAQLYNIALTAEQISQNFQADKSRFGLSDIVTSGLQFNLATAPSTGSTWTDSSGNGRNATLQGSPSYVSNNGGGIRLNNEDLNCTDYISVP
jgi:hypothetical protein